MMRKQKNTCKKLFKIEAIWFILTIATRKVSFSRTSNKICKNGDKEMNGIWFKFQADNILFFPF